MIVVVVVVVVVVVSRRSRSERFVFSSLDGFFYIVLVNVDLIQFPHSIPMFSHVMVDAARHQKHARNSLFLATFHPGGGRHRFFVSKSWVINGTTAPAMAVSTPSMPPL